MNHQNLISHETIMYKQDLERIKTTFTVEPMRYFLKAGFLVATFKILENCLKIIIYRCMFFEKTIKCVYLITILVLSQIPLFQFLTKA